MFTSIMICLFQYLRWSSIDYFTRMNTRSMTEIQTYSNKKNSVHLFQLTTMCVLSISTRFDSWGSLCIHINRSNMVTASRFRNVQLWMAPLRFVYLTYKTCRLMEMNVCSTSDFQSKRIVSIHSKCIICCVQIIESQCKFLIRDRFREVIRTI